MRAQIEILAQLQSIDREIKEQNDQKAGLMGQLNAKEAVIQAKTKEFAQLSAAFAEMDKLRQDKDRFLQDEGKKTMAKRMRMNSIKNAKELQALQREIDLLKQNNSDVEEELIKILEELDKAKSHIEDKEAEIKTLQDEWSAQEQDLLGQVSEIEKAVAEAATRRQSIAAQVARDLISRYELIFSRRGGTAVVEVAGGICQGCYMNIPPQLGNEIIKSEKIHLCPSCQRILYARPAAVEEQMV